MMKLLGVVLILVLLNLCHGGLLSWLFKKKKTEPPVTKVDDGHNGKTIDAVEDTDMVITAKIPFEISPVHEKFLREAEAYTSLQLSELDSCHHKVILGLEQSCSDLNEEDLSRLSVNLLNCQSLAEGRPIYQCTSDMPLNACTSGMDGTAWNAYHIVSNRARAVCYSYRQQQFRTHTEMAVNKLMVTAQHQIKTMEELHDSQEALGHVTSETLESLRSGHEKLKKEQDELSSAQMVVRSFISSNLRELNREKKLFTSSQRELASITHAIKYKLDEAKDQLLNQENSQREAHAMILNDLSTIQDNAFKVWEKLDASTQKILLAHEETVNQYNKVMGDLERMNATVHHLMDLVHSTRAGLEKRLSWITSLLGGTDNTIIILCSATLHVAYFLFAMVAASFLQVPYMTRLVLVILVPLNAVAEIRHGNSLPFFTLTTVLAFSMFVNLILSFGWSLYQRRKKVDSICDKETNQHNRSLTQSVAHNSTVKEMNKTQKLHETTLDSNHITRSSDSGNSRHALNLSGISSCLTVRTERHDDYSSDEDPHSPEKSSLLRRRFVGQFSSVNDLEPVEEVVGNEVEKEDCNVMSPPLTTESTAKTLSQVRRQLLHQLGSPRFTDPSPRLNLSLDTAIRTKASSNRSTPSRSMTPRRLCASVCRTGQQCRNSTTGDSQHCHIHSRSTSVSSSRRSTPVPQ